MRNNWFILKSFVHFFRHKPINLILLFAITLVLGLFQGVSIVIIIPLLGIIYPSQLASSQNKWIDLIHSFFKQNGVEINLALVLLCFAIFLVLMSFLRYFQTIIQTAYQQEFSYTTRKRLFKKIITCDWDALYGKSKHSHIQVLTSEIPKMTMYYYYYLTLATKLIFISTHIFLSFLISVKFTLLVLLFGALLFLLLRSYLKKAISLGAGNIQSFRKMLKYIDDYWQTIKVAKVHHSEQYYFHKYDESNKQMLDYQFRQVKNRAIPQLQFTIAGIIFLVGIVYFSINFLLIPFTFLFVLILLFARIFPQFTGLNNDLNMLVSNVESVKMVLALDNDLIEHDFKEIESTNSIALNNQIEIKDLSFSYSPDNLLFLNFSDFIPARKITGIMGVSGCGKTTLIDMIAGLLTPTKGEILVDGFALHKNNLPNWKNELGYLPQDSFFIDGTIRENLTWDSRHILTDIEIFDILKLVGIDKLILNQKNALDTSIVNYSFHFSGGERQRLALARVLIRKPNLLLLDEATSALDYESEELIMNCLKRLKDDLTIVVVTHQRRLISYFDKTIYLDQNGKYTKEE